MITNYLEVEIKLKITSVDQIKKDLSKLGFKIEKQRFFEKNAVFDNPDLQLRLKGQLLRLRIEGEENKLTFKKKPKGRDAKQLYKVREEIELNISDYQKMFLILENLGYQPVFKYEKYREIYSKENIHVMVDETPIGDYIEIEGAADKIDEIAAELGYSPKSYITMNYHSLFLNRGLTGDMVFKKQV